MKSPTIIHTVLTGQPVAFGPNGELSAINKQPNYGYIQLSPRGLTTDKQGDQNRHGGLEKALHHYPGEHYDRLQQDFSEETREKLRIGQVGENLSSFGLTEKDVCIGDVFSLGQAIIQVSQARQPCWKLNVKFDYPDMAMIIQHLRLTGWYYRVLQPGKIKAGDSLHLIERKNAEWSIAKLLDVIFGKSLLANDLKAISKLENLSDSWRTLADNRLRTGKIEDWAKRVTTPTTQT